MKEKEISEIRRRFRPEKSNIVSVRGCYVNQNREIVSEFNQSMTMMPEDEGEKFLSILKRTLSGTVGKNLVDIEFTTQQVVDSQEHKLLMALRDSGLKDEEAIQSFFRQVIDSVFLGENYLILLAHDTYDVPHRSKDGQRLEDSSSEVFSYVLCSICPVKTTKAALSYYVNENQFRTCQADWVVSPPELGFMFPAFDDRSANLYNALYYTRNIAENYPEFVEAVFRRNVPMTAAAQKEAFQTILCSTLEEECSFETVQAVHGRLREMIEEHKENKEEAPLTVSREQVKGILKAKGASDVHVQAFEEQFDREFGPEMQLSPKNIVDTRQVEVTSAGVKIHITSEQEHRIETRIIDGIKYIMIRADEGVELNGIPVKVF